MLHDHTGESKVNVIVTCGCQTFSLRSHFQKNYIFFNTVHPPDIHRIFNTCVPYAERRNFSRLKLCGKYPNQRPESPMFIFLVHACKWADKALVCMPSIPLHDFV